jgi:hypothetical protein
MDEEEIDDQKIYKIKKCGSGHTPDELLFEVTETCYDKYEYSPPSPNPRPQNRVANRKSAEVSLRNYCEATGVEQFFLPKAPNALFSCGGGGGVKGRSPSGPNRERGCVAEDDYVKTTRTENVLFTQNQTPPNTLGYEAAKKYIHKKSVDGKLNRLKKPNADVTVTAMNKDVQRILFEAMSVYLREGYGDSPLSSKMFEESIGLESIKAFGTNGGCLQVAPVFAYLLNSIHKEKVVEWHLVAQYDRDHAMVKEMKENPRFIDATWRQGGQNIADWDNNKNKKGREMLAMVRVTEEEPTLKLLELGVINGLLEIYEGKKYKNKKKSEIAELKKMKEPKRDNFMS